MASYRRLARSLVGPGASIEELLAATEGRLGRPIRLRYNQYLPAGVVGTSTPGPPGGHAVIAVDRSVSRERAPYVIAHEVAHLVLHDRAAGRSNYDDGEEWSAELLGTLLVQRMHERRLPEPSRVVR